MYYAQLPKSDPCECKHIISHLSKLEFRIQRPSDRGNAECSYYYSLYLFVNKCRIFYININDGKPDQAPAVVLCIHNVLDISCNDIDRHWTDKF